jgi:hypothetical protein
MHESLEAVKQLVIEHNLPKKDLALFGIRCPYCGKSDRIRQLEVPESLNGGLEADEMAAYEKLWQLLTPADESLGVCKFCLNPLRLLANGQAESFFSCDENHGHYRLILDTGPSK